MNQIHGKMIKQSIKNRGDETEILSKCKIKSQSYYIK